MFAKIIALFAVLAVAFAAPAPAPAPQVLAYSAGLDYGGYYGGGVAPALVSPYGSPYAYSPYSAYPAGAVYVR